MINNLRFWIVKLVPYIYIHIPGFALDISVVRWDYEPTYTTGACSWKHYGLIARENGSICFSGVMDYPLVNIQKTMENHNF